MKRFIHSVLWTIAAIGVVLLLGLGYVWINEWQPAPEEIIYSDSDIHSILPDTLTILTWNTGYAGLGDDMDFFLDGGKGARTSRERTEENLQNVTDFLTSCDADIILLQEVDRNSRRTYRIDQFAYYQEALPDYYGYFAYNYKTLFAPVPLHAPTGRIEAGLAIFSRFPPEEVCRYQYPSRYGFPERLFLMKLGLMGAWFGTTFGHDILIGNTHNTAYDDGGMRTEEMEWIRNSLVREEPGLLSITGGDWNQNPPGYIARSDEIENPYFSPLQIKEEFFSPGWEFAYDASTPSNRYLYETLSDSTTRTTLDFFLASPGIECLQVKTVDLGFHHSDHNPVVATFVIQ